jgi:S1-C subfamily serine protease
LLVQEVLRGSPAALAGLRGANRNVRVGNYFVPAGGDLITAIDGMPVERENDISRVAAHKHAGDKMELTIFRAGRSMQVTITLAALDDRV